MASKTTFSSDGLPEIDESIKQVHVDEPFSYFEVERCIKYLKSSTYKRVALQFPDELMAYANYVNLCIAKEVEAKLYILADTSYGSCCVDEVAASHMNVDAIIHFGHSCLSTTQTLPVLYVFGRSPFSSTEFKSKFSEKYPSKSEKILLFYDVTYEHCISEVSKDLSAIYSNLSISTIPFLKYSSNTHSILEKGPQSLSDKNTSDYHESNRSFNSSCFGREYSLKYKVEEYDVLYLGRDSLTLRNLIFKFNKNKVYSYVPASNEIKLVNTSVNRALMKRFYLIEKAKDAKIVGIIIGTLGVSGYKEMLSRLKSVLKHAGKKFYVFIIGKINVAKMANFMEIDIFVLLACPENTLIDSKEFYKPIITPYEVEIACLHTRKWTGNYVTDFCEILPGAACYVEIDDGTIGDETEYSLISGQMRNMKMSKVECDPSTDIAKRNKENQLQSYTAGEYLSLRSWQGLEVHSGNSEVCKALEGRKGIAMNYENEPSS